MRDTRPVARDAAAHPPARVLIVEDDVAQAKLARRLVEAAGEIGRAHV